MSPESKTEGSIRYAAFKLRFRALIIDVAICLGLFLLGAIVAGIIFENSIDARIAVFVVLVLVILCYEPFMVARYGGTFGHRRSNIRIVCLRSLANLPLWKAAMRSLLKETIGLISFIFMFSTNRAQSLHDLAAGARVIIRNPGIASEDDCFTPTDTRFRRIVVILIYNIGLLVVVSIATSMVSYGCVNLNVCSDFESLFLSIINGAWVVVAGVTVILGWKGRLPGCRPTNAV